MTISVDDIKSWLNSTGKSRQWLAKQCLVSKKTVDNWLSDGRIIPKARLLKIEELMNEKKATSSPYVIPFNGVVVAPVRANEEQWKKIALAAAEAGEDIETFIRNASILRAESLLRSDKEE